MNAAAHLAAQGWRGAGHSLHKTSDDIGLAKPLLLNRKSDKKGIGSTQHFTSDQWWMNAFDEQLQGLDTSKDGQVTQTVETGKLNQFEKGGLAKYSVYATFVRGGFLEGTIKDDKDSSTSDSDNGNKTDSTKTDRKDKKKETKEERRIRKEDKKRKKQQDALLDALRQAKKGKSDASDDANDAKKQRRAKKEDARRKRKAKEEGK